MSLRRMQSATSKPHGDGHAHDHHHGAPQPLSPQFEDIDQQNESYIVGMWTFLVTEIMFFGALFFTYSLYRTLYFDAWVDAHKFLDILWGTLNTFILLTSSLTMVLAVWAAQQGKKWLMISMLAVTILCSFGFLGIKYIEYSAKFEEKLFPGKNFDYVTANRMYKEHHGAGHVKGVAESPATADEAHGDESHTDDSHAGEAKAEESHSETASHGEAGHGDGEHGDGGHGNKLHGKTEIGMLMSKKTNFDNQPKEGFNGMMAEPTQAIALANTDREAQKEAARGRRAQLFFSVYFAMTGLHGVHVLVGILMMSVIIWMRVVDHIAVKDYMPTELVGLYWHFVDIVWIFLFPLMYLIS
jgi:cytochrome c oxidase subunit 3